MEIPNDDLIAMYAMMCKIRHFEERIREAYYEEKLPAFDIAAGPVPGEMHLSAGQEPVAVGMMPHLKAGDAITATHRPHHVAIAQGVDLELMAAEIFGKDENRRKAKQYVQWVLRQRVGPITVDTSGPRRDDLSIVSVPLDCVAYVMGKNGIVLRNIEEEYGTLMFFGKPTSGAEEGVEKLMILGSRRSRRGRRRERRTSQGRGFERT